MMVTEKVIAQKTNNGAPPGNSTQVTAAQPAVRPQEAGNRAYASGRDIVMMGFINSSMEMTRTILDSQARVMTAYLNGSAGAASQDVSGPETMRLMPEFVPNNNNRQRTSVQTDLEPVLQQQNLKSISPVSSPEAVEGNDNGKNGVRTYITGGEPKLAAAPGLQAAQSVPAAETEMSPEQLITALIEIVSQRTGYPPEMLDPTLDLEADLGIDSIKRIEILNNFRRLLPESKQHALEDGIEKLAGVKSLQGIIDWIKMDFSDLSKNSPDATDPATGTQAVLADRSA